MSHVVTHNAPDDNESEEELSPTAVALYGVWAHLAAASITVDSDSQVVSRGSFAVFCDACPGLIAPPLLNSSDAMDIFDDVANGAGGLGLEDFCIALQMIATKRFPLNDDECAYSALLAFHVFRMPNIRFPYLETCPAPTSTDAENGVSRTPRSPASPMAMRSTLQRCLPPSTARRMRYMLVEPRSAVELQHGDENACPVSIPNWRRDDGVISMATPLRSTSMEDAVPGVVAGVEAAAISVHDQRRHDESGYAQHKINSFSSASFVARIEPQTTFRSPLAHSTSRTGQQRGNAGHESVLTPKTTPLNVADALDSAIGACDGGGQALSGCTAESVASQTLPLDIAAAYLISSVDAGAEGDNATFCPSPRTSRESVSPTGLQHRRRSCCSSCLASIAWSLVLMTAFMCMHLVLVAHPGLLVDSVDVALRSLPTPVRYYLPIRVVNGCVVVGPEELQLLVCASAELAQVEATGLRHSDNASANGVNEEPVATAIDSAISLTPTTTASYVAYNETTMAMSSVEISASSETQAGVFVSTPIPLATEDTATVTPIDAHDSTAAAAVDRVETLGLGASGMDEVLIPSISQDVELPPPVEAAPAELVVAVSSLPVLQECDDPWGCDDAFVPT